VVRERPAARFFLVGEGPLLPDSSGPGGAPRLGDRFVFAGFQRDVARDALGVRPERVSLAVGRARRSRASKRWRWASRSSPPTPTACSTSSPMPRRGDRAARAMPKPWRRRSSGRRSSRCAASWAPRRGSPAGSTTSARSSARWSASTRCSTPYRVRHGGAVCCGADLSFLATGVSG
jgi:hypothetical protein